MSSIAKTIPVRDDDPSAQLAQAAANAIWDRKGFDVVALRVKDIVGYTDYMVIASATSDRHAIALSDSVEEHLLKEFKDKPIGVEGRTWGRWVLLDYSDIVVHIFHRPVRDYYQLQRLFADAPRLELTEPKWVSEVSPDQLIEQSFDYGDELWASAALDGENLEQYEEAEEGDDASAEG